MYRIVEKKIGYIVEECETLEEAKTMVEAYGKRKFRIEDEQGKEVKAR